ncbi:hypothetical protein N665_0019s0028 [Sinapis alba]|nr:hypothetical protein N665_0019s0028 [Sinapis alba]
MAAQRNSSSASIGSASTFTVPLCHCSQLTRICISWTDENPGRRFFKCDEHGFLEWSDKDLSCLWQKRSLLEARDKTRRQSEENQALRAAFSRVNAQLAAVEAARMNVDNVDLLRPIEDIVKAATIQLEKKISQVIVYSWGGLFIATAVVMFMLKRST